MSNNSATLFRAWSKKFTKDKQPVEPDPPAKTVLALLDHFNGLHWNDRDRYGEDIRQLSAQVERLAKRVAVLEHRQPAASRHSYEEEPR